MNTVILTHFDTKYDRVFFSVEDFFDIKITTKCKHFHAIIIFKLVLPAFFYAIFDELLTFLSGMLSLKGYRIIPRTVISKYKNVNSRFLNLFHDLKQSEGGFVGLYFSFYLNVCFLSQNPVEINRL